MDERLWTAPKYGYKNGDRPSIIGSFVYICSFIDSVFLVFCRKKDAVYQKKSICMLTTRMLRWILLIKRKTFIITCLRI